MGSRISLFGVGYVGSVAAACLARDGHVVIAVDINGDKVEALNAGRPPIIEPGLPVLIENAIRSGRLRATTSLDEAVAATDISLICVGTPPSGKGLDVSAVIRVAADIARAASRKSSFHVVAVRSTLTPWTMERAVRPAMETACGGRAGEDFGLAYYPEFLREGCAIEDYDHPSHVVLAASDEITRARLAALTPHAPSAMGMAEAEAVKMVLNSMRAVTVSAVNEIGAVLAAQSVDSRQVMALAAADRRMGRPVPYMVPGFAFGGSCLPKDLNAFRALGRQAGHATTIADAAHAANEALIARAAAMVGAAGGRRVSIIGLAFKAGGDDLRGSPYLSLAERLLADGFELRLFDPCLCVDRLTGANRAEIRARLPEVSSLLCESVETATAHAETLVLAHAEPGAQALDLARPEQAVIDLVRVRPDLRTSGRYVGLYW